MGLINGMIEDSNNGVCLKKNRHYYIFNKTLSGCTYIDSLEEYKANKERLISNRLQLETGLEKLRKEQEEKEVSKEDVLHEIKSVNDILKNPDVSYEEKGTLIRTIVDQIVYDKESGKMYFDIIVS